MESERNVAHGASQSGQREATLDPSLTPYRNWALQNNVISILGGEAEWGGSGRSPTTSPDPVGAARGNAALVGELEPDPEYRLRIRSIVWMFVAVLASGAFNQLTTFGLKVSTASYLATTGMVAIAIAVSIFVLPRLAPRAFTVVGQLLLIYTYGLIVVKCDATGGAASPYAIWWVFVMLYGSYFLERRRALTNFAAITVAMVLPSYLVDGRPDAETAIYLGVLVSANWVMAFSVLAGRELSRRAERAVRYLALADPLTGVANLRAFESKLDEMIRSGESEFALVVADMNGLKGANAAFGYTTGDDMLRRLGRLLCENCDERAQVARVRGDEFAVLLPGADERRARGWEEEFRARIDAHNEAVRNRAPRISVETGLASYPRDATRTAQLFDIADKRMLAAKRVRVQPPYEIDAAVASPLSQTLRPAAEVFDPRRRQMRKAPLHAGVRWLLISAALGAYALVPGLTRHQELLAATMAVVAMAFGLGGYIAQSGFKPLPYLYASDVATLMVIAPNFWVSGGWSSPLQPSMIFPIAFYAQFMAGRQAAARVVAAIVIYASGFWLSEAVGASPGPPDEVARTLFVTIITALVVITIILQNNRRNTDEAIATIRHSATFDPLTGVYNVHAFRADLVSTIKSASYEPQDVPRGAPVGAAADGPRPALLIADIDDFRGVNNRGGHLAGDAVLKSVAERLRKTVGDDGKVYRIDCDEFAVLFNVDDDSEADVMLERVTLALVQSRPMQSEMPESVTLSVGMATWRRGGSPTEFVEVAEERLEAMRSRRRERTGPRGGATLL